LHLGLYACPPDALNLCSAASTRQLEQLEQLEGLEQLRFLDMGLTVGWFIAVRLTGVRSNETTTAT
jgi:3-deoxy-manno-octulosonate cytidylyltransferase (CMP-KDO synthetase)